MPPDSARRYRRLRAHLKRVVADACDDAEAILATPPAKRSAGWELEVAGLLADAERAAHRAQLVKIAASPPHHAAAIALHALRSEPE